jgi:hypothetical protein
MECGGQVPIIAAESEKAMIIVQNDFAAESEKAMIIVQNDFAAESEKAMIIVQNDFAAESEMVFVFTAVVKFFFTIKNEKYSRRFFTKYFQNKKMRNIFTIKK